MKKKNYISLFLSVLLLFSFSSSAMADQKEAPQDSAPTNYSNFGSLTYQDSKKSEFTQTDSESLKEWIEKDNIEVPEGYHLTSVSTTVLYSDRVADQIRSLAPDSDTVTPMTTYWYMWIDNVRTVGERYYADSPLYSDWMDGPLPDGFTYQLKDTVNSNYSSELNFKVSDISAKVGFNASTGHEISRTFRTESVSSSKKINVKIYANYLVKNFDEWRYLRTGALEVPGTREKFNGSAWKPIGYIIHQFQYSK
ncbi:hypothetical protein ACN9MH_23125 [Paenibacillus silvae]|uniref:hypothetical protein n=1 Tax=Paenibacillus silvae TaxID=1325358 RepID=UPI0025A289B8|nr:hypothetical protein [Paenibacillus silvae]MDM5275935.1 hypothetical protein [Paenibacillus silvae]